MTGNFWNLGVRCSFWWCQWEPKEPNWKLRAGRGFRETITVANTTWGECSLYGKGPQLNRRNAVNKTIWASLIENLTGFPSVVYCGPLSLETGNKWPICLQSEKHSQRSKCGPARLLPILQTQLTTRARALAIQVPVLLPRARVQTPLWMRKVHFLVWRW